MAVLFGPLRPYVPIFIATLLLSIAAFGVSRVTRLRVPFVALAIASFAAFVTLVLALDQLAQRWSPADEGQRVIAEVQIDSLVRRTSTGAEFDALLYIESPSRLQRTLRARVSWRDPSKVPRAAERWRFCCS